MIVVVQACWLGWRDAVVCYFGFGVVAGMLATGSEFPVAIGVLATGMLAGLVRTMPWALAARAVAAVVCTTGAALGWLNLLLQGGLRLSNVVGVIVLSVLVAVVVRALVGVRLVRCW